MEFMDIWNDICFRIKNKNYNVLEREFQIIAENIFERIGWSQHRGEINTQKIIPVGSSGNVRPDIIISDCGKDNFVVELKKPNIAMSERNIEQLFSYMRLLKLNFGILLGETLQVYYDLPNDNEAPKKITEIHFVSNSKEGVNLIKLLSKSEYSPEKIENYCKEKIDIEAKNEKVQIYLDKLCSADGANMVIDYLKKQLAEDFSEDIIASIIENININISKKTSNGSGIDPVPKPDVEDKSKDKSKYKLNGEWAGGIRENSGKGRLVLATVKLYIEKHPNITLNELNDVFKDLQSKNIGFVDTYDNAKTKCNHHQKKKTYHFLQDPIKLNDGQIIVVCREWGNTNISDFIDRAKKLGFTIEREKE